MKLKLLLVSLVLGCVASTWPSSVETGEALAKHGIKFFYHTHGYEFLPYRDGTLFDLLMAETKPEYVRIEMDV